MNEDQGKGRIKEGLGKLQKNLGRLVDDPKTEAAGAANEAEGKIQKGWGDLKHKVSKAID